MNLCIIDHDFHYEMEKLTRVFFPDEKVNVLHELREEENFIVTKRIKNSAGDIIYVKAVVGEAEKEREELLPVGTNSDDTCELKMAQILFDLLKEMLDYTPPWGVLTGVRPAKLMNKLIEENGEKAAVDTFLNEFMVSEEKTSLALTVSKKELPIMNESEEKSFSLYISVPFCPTRCAYCSFVSQSNEQAKKLIPEYVEKLCEEIKITGNIVKDLGLKLESVYYGGGTPTVLSAEQFRQVSTAIAESFDLSSVREYTVEAGRPDTITQDKLAAIKESHTSRISINPQTFNDSVLKEIGRKHTGKDAENAFLLARKNNFDNINMDLIAGLPTDTPESFSDTLEKAISFSPESITVHTLSLKRSSNIVQDNSETNDALLVKEMLEIANKKLTESGYEPYYMYRQSKCLGNFENVGWAKKGYECLYNVYMMEECHSVIALGAGGVTKLKDPYSPKLERVYNHKYPYEYLGRFDEIIERKNQISEFYKNI